MNAGALRVPLHQMASRPSRMMGRNENFIFAHEWRMKYPVVVKLVDCLVRSWLSFRRAS